MDYKGKFVVETWHKEYDHESMPATFTFDTYKEARDMLDGIQKDNLRWGSISLVLDYEEYSK